MIQIEISGGLDIGRAIDEAQDKMLANRIKEGYFMFNELKVELFVDSNPTDILKLYFYSNKIRQYETKYGRIE